MPDVGLFHRDHTAPGAAALAPHWPARPFPISRSAIQAFLCPARALKLQEVRSNVRTPRAVVDVQRHHTRLPQICRPAPSESCTGDDTLDCTRQAAVGAWVEEGARQNVTQDGV